MRCDANFPFMFRFFLLLAVNRLTYSHTKALNEPASDSIIRWMHIACNRRANRNEKAILIFDCTTNATSRWFLFDDLASVVIAWVWVLELTCVLVGTSCDTRDNIHRRDENFVSSRQCQLPQIMTVCLWQNPLKPLRASTVSTTKW